MKIFQILANSVKKSIDGTEKLWIVFWFWGVVVYFSSVVIGWVV